MTKRKYQSIENYIPEKGETNLEPSMTLKNEAYTIRELLERFVKGQPLPDEIAGYYDNPTSFEDVDETQLPDFDLADATRIQREMRQNQLNFENERGELQAVDKGGSEADDPRKQPETQLTQNQKVE